ncbi:acyl carrier protein [Cavenderia fasciculata]|uniref:Acyl carrier protein n=1 Tax=Cavenderia fasciculata TaxID=261658 RepID=F4QBL8_CACFS|nr:acyl carrier protein [Cavenderia fasciculata]EGG14606.1 acyl carrier protein [Cavenderia fasciculata]|eukprot:XP_004351114.1 acyl carrier protein [Cavenderia fasciculata]
MFSRAIRSAFTSYTPSMMARTSAQTTFRYYSAGGALSEGEVSERVLDVVSKYDKCVGKKVTPASTFSELGLDSLDSADVLVAIEEEFNIEIPDDEADKINSCKETISYIRRTPTAK